MQVVTDPVGLTAPLSKKGRVLDNLAAGSVSLSKEEFDGVNRLVEGLNVHGLRSNQALRSALWR